MSVHRDFASVGWRARIGAITPAVGLAITADFHRIAPEGVALLLGRVAAPLDETGVEQIAGVGDYVADAARFLARAGASSIVWNTSTGSLIKGIGYDQELVKRMEDATGIPCTTASTAMLQAFRTLGFEKVCLAVPYIDEVTEREKLFLEGNGFQVLGYKGLQYLNVSDIVNTAPSTMYKVAKEADLPEADGIFISCAGLSVLNVLEKLEHDLKKPVLATNQVSLWHAFQLAGIREPIEGFGSLLRKL